MTLSIFNKGQNISCGWTESLCVCLLRGFASCLIGIRMDAWCMCSFHPHNAADVAFGDWLSVLRSMSTQLSGIVQEHFRMTAEDKQTLKALLYLYYVLCERNIRPSLSAVLASLWIMLMPNKYYVHIDHLHELFSRSCEIWTCLVELCLLSYFVRIITSELSEGLAMVGTIFF